MFNLYRNERTIAAATFAAALAVVTAIGTGNAAADPTWSVTVKNTGSAPADVSIMAGGSTVGKGTVAAKGSATITVPAKLGTFSWKAENGGKECGRHEVDLIRSKSFEVACNAPSTAASPSAAGSSTASNSPQPAATDASKQTSGSTAGAPPKLPDLRLKSLGDYQKKIDDAEADLKQINAKLSSSDKLTQPQLDALKSKADEDIKTINSTKAILGELKSVIETNPANTLPPLPKVSADGSDGGASKAIKDFGTIFGRCHPAGDAAPDVSKNDGKHAVSISCKM
jgi:hypothetical protein